MSIIQAKLCVQFNIDYRCLNNTSYKKLIIYKWYQILTIRSLFIFVYISGLGIVRS